MVRGMAAPSLSTLLAPFEALLGGWEGEGRGLWNPDPSFRYREWLELTPIPDRALLRWEQRTEVWESGQLSHTEQGFLRLLPEAAVELVIATPSGYTEIHRGEFSGGALSLELVNLGSAPGARPLDLVKRRLAMADQMLTHEVSIAVGGTELAPHVRAQLRRRG